MHVNSATLKQQFYSCCFFALHFKWNASISVSHTPIKTLSGWDLRALKAADSLVSCTRGGGGQINSGGGERFVQPLATSFCCVGRTPFPAQRTSRRRRCCLSRLPAHLIPHPDCIGLLSTFLSIPPPPLPSPPRQRQVLFCSPGPVALWRYEHHRRGQWVRRALGTL